MAAEFTTKTVLVAFVFSFLILITTSVTVTAFSRNTFMTTMRPTTTAKKHRATSTTTSSGSRRNAKNRKNQNDDSASTTSTTTTTTLPVITKFPKLVVLDLDNTVWTPELYQLRRSQRSQQMPVAGKDVKLLPGARHLIETIRSKTYFPSSTKFAVASRTKSVEWAQDLLDQFDLRSVLDYVEIFPGSKRQHFRNLHQQSSSSSGSDSRIAFGDMIFWDDSRDGKYGNCEPVSQMGVFSVHCPSGLETSHIWTRALERYQEWDGMTPTIVEWDGSVTTTTTTTTTNTATTNIKTKQPQEGIVKMVNHDKRFGFIQIRSTTTTQQQPKNNDVFFHFSNLPMGVTSVKKGDVLQFTMERDPRNGKPRATNLQVATVAAGVAAGDSNRNDNNNNSITMPAFSMNMPFAALLANGYKTLESRNGTMFQSYREGTHMLLHVGRRTYPDGDKHLEIMTDHLLSSNQNQQDVVQQQIDQLKSLPAGFDRGMIVAIVELGRTYDTTLAQRSTTEMQRQIAAYGVDSGRQVTEIKRVQYLKRPIVVAAQGGVFDVSIPTAVLPDDWYLLPNINESAYYRVKRNNRDDDNKNEDGGSSASMKNHPPKSSSSTTATQKQQQPIYSISG